MIVFISDILGEYCHHELINVVCFNLIFNQQNVKVLIISETPTPKICFVWVTVEITKADSTFKLQPENI